MPFHGFKVASSSFKNWTQNLPKINTAGFDSLFSGNDLLLTFICTTAFLILCNVILIIILIFVCKRKKQNLSNELALEEKGLKTDNVLKEE